MGTCQSVACEIVIGVVFLEIDKSVLALAGIGNIVKGDPGVLAESFVNALRRVFAYGNRNGIKGGVIREKALLVRVHGFELLFVRNCFAREVAEKIGKIYILGRIKIGVKEAGERTEGGEGFLRRFELFFGEGKPGEDGSIFFRLLFLCSVGGDADENVGDDKVFFPVLF